MFHLGDVVWHSSIDLVLWCIDCCIKGMTLCPLLQEYSYKGRRTQTGRTREKNEKNKRRNKIGKPIYKKQTKVSHFVQHVLIATWQHLFLVTACRASAHHLSSTLVLSHLLGPGSTNNEVIFDFLSNWWDDFFLDVSILSQTWHGRLCDGKEVNALSS